VITESFSVEERDFTIPLAWEGNRDKLHTSDSYAREQGHPGRLFSGTAGLALAVTRAGVEERFGGLSELSWQFGAPAYLHDALASEFTEDEAEVKGRITRGDTEISAGALRFTSSLPDGHSPDGHATESISRTVSQGDVELFDWWTSRDRSPHSESPMVPALVLTLVGSGFVSDMKRFSQEDLSPVLRSYKWRFNHSVPAGSTVVVSLDDESERQSKSKPGWAIWKGLVSITDGHKPPAAESEFVILYKTQGQSA
jgi:acyl dehydratase